MIKLVIGVMVAQATSATARGSWNAKYDADSRQILSTRGKTSRTFLKNVPAIEERIQTLISLKTARVPFIVNFYGVWVEQTKIESFNEQAFEYHTVFQRHNCFHEFDFLE